MDLQPLVLLRTQPITSSSTSIDLQIGGYVVSKAYTDDLALWMQLTAAPEAIVVDLESLEAEEFLARLDTSVPVLVLSSLPTLTQRLYPSVAAIRQPAQRHELIAAIDRLLIDQPISNRSSTANEDDGRTAASVPTKLEISAG